VTGFGIVAGVAALFFVAGILTGVLGVMALSAMRDHRGRGAGRRDATRRTETLNWDRPRWPAGPDWEDRPSREGQLRPDEIGEAPPPWPGGRRDLAARSDRGGIKAWRDSRGRAREGGPRAPVSGARGPLASVASAT
jgi:hypothetical protein